MMRMKIAMASLDVGTSGIRASAYDLKGTLLAQGKSAYQTFYPLPGWAEQNPHDWEAATYQALAEMQAQLPASCRLAVLAITGQCPSYVPLDKNCRPLGNALIYQDNRAVAEAEWIARRSGAERIHRLTGHSPWAFYILPKIVWQRNHQLDLFHCIGKIAQPTDYVCYLLTGELVTDRTHANATLLYDLAQADWSTELLDEMGLSREMLPERVLQPWEQAGTLKKQLSERLKLPYGLPIIVGAADSQCSCLGTGTLHPEQISEMSGSSSCLNSAVAKPLAHPAVGHYHHIVPHYFCTEMGLNTTGIAVNWFMEEILGWNADSYGQAQREADRAPAGADNLLFIPYLCDGERDDPHVKGGFYGLTMKHGRSEMLRSVYEGVALSIRKRISLLEEAGCRFTEMRVSGGGARSHLWNQIKSDVLNLPVRAIASVDGAELGAAMLGAISHELFSSWEDAVAACVPEGVLYTPDPDNAARYEGVFECFLHLENRLRDGVSSGGEPNH
jgi:xylulokinase